MNQPNNRRHQDTVKRIQEAMLTLLDEKEFERITVQDVCTLAEINRSTFYRHYVDIYDLMGKLEKQIQSGIVQQWAAEKGSEEPVTQAALQRLLTYILAHRTFYRAYLREYPSRNHREEMQRIFDGYLQPLFENYGVVSRNRMQYYYRFAAAGFLSVIAQWLNQEMPESPEEIARILYAMLRVPR